MWDKMQNELIKMYRDASRPESYECSCGCIWFTKREVFQYNTESWGSAFVAPLEITDRMFILECIGCGKIQPLPFNQGAIKRDKIAMESLSAATDARNKLIKRTEPLKDGKDGEPSPTPAKSSE